MTTICHIFFVSRITMIYFRDFLLVFSDKSPEILVIITVKIVAICDFSKYAGFLSFVIKKENLIT